MKKRPYLLLWGFVLCAASCVSTIELKLYTPQEIILPSHLKHLGILDHSQGFDPTVNESIQFLPINLPKEYREEIDSSFLSFSAVLGAYAQASSSADSLKTTQIDLQLRRALPDSFPPPLPQEVIEPLCKTYGIDGLLVLEYFKIDFTDMPREFGVEPSKKGSLTVGWRVYDGKDFSVVYQDVFLQELPYITNFKTNQPGKSGRKIKQIATIEMGTMAGNTIIKILARTHIKGERKLFTGKFGPTDEIALNMKKAGALAEAGKWEAAMALWNPIASHRGYGKSCGKAAYNMAVACEHLGNIPLAIQWIGIARTQNIEEAFLYQELLKYRAEEIQ